MSKKKYEHFSEQFKPTKTPYASLLENYTMNFYYHDNELNVFEIDDRADHIDKPYIHPEITRQFQRKSKETKDEMIKKLTALKNLDVIPIEVKSKYEHVMPKIFERINIYTKKFFDEQLSRGITWLENKLKGANYILVTEKVRNVDNVGMRAYDQRAADNGQQLIHLKSSDWIAKIALERMAPTKRPIFMIDEGNLNATTTIPTSGDTFVLFDDGLYSGTQKATSISNLLKKQHKFKLYLVAPFFTQQAIDRIRAIFMTTSVSEHVRKKQNYISWKIKGKDIAIYLWTGGTKMDSTTDIIYDVSGGDFDFVMKILYLTVYDENEYGNENIFTMNANIAAPLQYKPEVASTMSLFEHKIPDYVSCIEFVGAYFTEAMKDHYSYNPPYKNLLPKTIGGMNSAAAKARIISHRRYSKSAFKFHGSRRPMTPSIYQSSLIASEVNILRACKFDKPTMAWFDEAIAAELEAEALQERILTFPQLDNAEALSANMMVECGYITTYGLLNNKVKDRLYMLLREIIARVVHREQNKQNGGTIRTGPRGGRYIVANGKKMYI